MIQQVKRWAYNGVEYKTEEEATMAAIKAKLGLPFDATIEACTKKNATDLVNLISTLSRKQTRPY